MFDTKTQFRGLCSDKKCEFICINEHFFRKRNEENGLFAQTLTMQYGNNADDADFV